DVLSYEFKTHGTILSIEYKLGVLFIKLSIDETPSPSKKNWVVISLPLLLTQVLKHPFSTKNIFLERLPSASKTVFAGTVTGVKSGLRMLHLFGIDFSFDMVRFYFQRNKGIYLINKFIQMKTKTQYLE